jgi:hypothetical protein
MFEQCASNVQPPEQFLPSGCVSTHFYAARAPEMICTEVVHLSRAPAPWIDGAGVAAVDP